MHSLERLCINLRHTSLLDQSDWLWNHLRSPYEMMVAWCERSGLERVVNGTDRLRVIPRFRSVAEVYEPDVWKHMMAQLRSGDNVADVGAYIGLYATALAKRVGESGRVIAFEPDAHNFSALEAHCKLNGLLERVTLVQAAVGDKDGFIPFEARGDSQSCVSSVPGRQNNAVRCVRLDSVCGNGRLDILKIDVEGYEEPVLRGGARLLHDLDRKPRLIYIEVHPYAWSPMGVTSGSLLDLLASYHYEVSDLRGQPVHEIKAYGEIVARCQANIA